MKISGVQKTTTIDYPGKISCVVFTLWCNFRCPFCHNPESVLPKEMAKISDSLIPDDAFFNFLESRKWKIDGVSICGWEPTLQSDLYDFAKKIKDMWFLVKLDTNWRDFKIVHQMIQDWILDYVAVDIKHDIKKYSTATGTLENSDYFDNYQKLRDLLLTSKQNNISNNIQKNINIDYEYRTTVIKWMHTLDDIKAMAQHIKWAKNYYLQNFVWWNTLDPNFKWESFSDAELEEMRQIALQYVQNCKIRK